MKKQQHQQKPEPILKCPRCDSANTKFCYYNNYNKSQPRHFCKTCKRHWTQGGALRRVPAGGGRKNKRLKTSNAGKTSTVVPIQWQQQKNPIDCSYNGVFPFPSVDSFNTIPPSISTSFQPPSIDDYTVSQTWQVPIASNGMDMANLWNLDDIDAFVFTDINISWDDDDDSEIKP